MNPTTPPRPALLALADGTVYRGRAFGAPKLTTGEVCLELGRRFVLVDDSEQAMAVMAQRFEDRPDIEWIGIDSAALRKSSPPGAE